MKILSNLASATVKSKVRLWIEYFLIALVLVMAGVGTWFYIKSLRMENALVTVSAELIKANDRVALVEGVNAEQAEAIKTIKSVTEISDTMLKGVARDIEAMRNDDRTVSNRIKALEKTNEAVRQYLRTAVPSDVGCVLDQTCDPDASAVPETVLRPAAAVPAASPAPDKR